jgi:hypothetical protein
MELLAAVAGGAPFERHAERPEAGLATRALANGRLGGGELGGADEGAAMPKPVSTTWSWRPSWLSR